MTDEVTREHHTKMSMMQTLNSAEVHTILGSRESIIQNVNDATLNFRQRFVLDFRESIYVSVSGRASYNLMQHILQGEHDNDKIMQHVLFDLALVMTYVGGKKRLLVQPYLFPRESVEGEHMESHGV